MKLYYGKLRASICEKIHRKIQECGPGEDLISVHVVENNEKMVMTLSEFAKFQLASNTPSDPLECLPMIKKIKDDTIDNLQSEIFVLKYNNAHLTRKLEEKLQQKIEMQNKLNRIEMRTPQENNDE